MPSKLQKGQNPWKVSPPISYDNDLAEVELQLFGWDKKMGTITR